MSSIVFVHGTGVREQAFNETFNKIRTTLASRKPDVSVLPCYWGSAYGSLLLESAKCVPSSAEAKGLGGDLDDEEDLAMWALLYQDPLLELRLLAQTTRQAAPLSLGQKPSCAQILEEFVSASTSSDMLDHVRGFGLEDRWREAFQQVLAFPDLRRALATANGLPPRGDDGNDAAREVLARAVLAETVRTSTLNGLPALTAPDRDNLIAFLTRVMGATDKETKSIFGRMAGVVVRPLLGVGQHAFTAHIRHRRSVVTHAYSAFPLDVLRYQARGEPLREFIRETVRNAQPPVYILAHSLGGIASFESLVEDTSLRLSGLITVGTQVPLLYESAALGSLAPDDPLPPHFPQWLNFYDPNDFLSYVGATLFPGKVEDVEVKSGQPFPQAHSAYWSNPQLWNKVLEFLQ